MPQPKIRSDQLNSGDFGTITSGGLEESLSAPVVIGSPISNGESLTFDGTNWVNSAGGGSGVTAGDGLSSAGGSPIGTQVLSTDSTVARTDITTETFTFGGVVSLNLNDTSQAADEDIWRISATGSSFVISTRTDADGAGNSAITFARTGTTVDTATIATPTHLTASGTGTSSALHINSNVPTIVFNDNDAGANAGVWDITSGTNQLLFRTRTDAHGAGATWLTVNRSGTTVGELAFTGTSMTFNGLPIVAGGSPYTGGASGLGSPQLITGNVEITGDLTVGGAVTMGSPAFGPQNYFADKAIDDTVNNSTTFVDDSELFITHIKNGFYQVSGLLLFRDVAVSGCGAKFDITMGGSTGDSALRVSSKLFTGAAAPGYDEQGLLSDTFDVIGLATGGGTSRVMLSGVAEFAFGTGSVQVTFAQNALQVGDLDLEAGSWIAFTRVGT